MTAVERCAGQRLSAVRLNSATSAVIGVFLTDHAATDTVSKVSIALARAEWIQHRQAELLDCEYFHVVFTVPEEIASIAYQNKKWSTWHSLPGDGQALRTIAADPKRLGAEIGFFAVLHTWGSKFTSSSTFALQWSPAAGSHLTALVGSLATPDSSCRCRSCPACSRSPTVSGAPSKRFRLGQSCQILLLPAISPGSLRAFVRYLAPLRKIPEWVVYCQTTLCRTRAGAGLRRTLHPSCGNLEQSSAGYRKRSNTFSDGRTIETKVSEKTFMTLSAEEFIPAISPPRFCRMDFTPHSLLRLFGQSLSARETHPDAANYWA